MNEKTSCWNMQKWIVVRFTGSAKDLIKDFKSGTVRDEWKDFMLKYAQMNSGEIY